MARAASCAEASSARRSASWLKAITGGGKGRVGEGVRGEGDRGECQGVRGEG